MDLEWPKLKECCPLVGLMESANRAREGTEQLCLLCIQALAEMNKWQEVLPLIQNIYDGIEGCPHTVIKLCILLYAKVEQFSQCHAITSVWLRCKDNSSESGYAEVASLYIEHVMVHQGRLVLVPQFLDSCTVLDADVKQSLVETFNITSKDNTDTHKPADCRRSHQKETVNEDSNEDDQETDIYDVVLSQIKAWVSLIASKLSYPSFRILLKIAGIAVGFYLIFSISVKGDIMTSTGQAAVIWQGILRTWKSIFTPYRMGR